MQKNFNEAYIHYFLQGYSGQKYVTKEELKNYFAARNPELSIQEFRRILYGLESRYLITTSGSGIYTIQSSSTNLRPKKRFAPKMSDKIDKLKKEIEIFFPYAEMIFWETKILHEFMTHQPNSNMIILETEKGIEESLFNHFVESNIGPIFLSPTRTEMERYVAQLSEPIIVSKLVTQSPKRQKGEKATYAKIEKILIDILVDQNKYYIYQGQELVSIYKGVFQDFVINEDSLLRYAGRRNATQKLKDFIQNKTSIKLRAFSEDSK
jgi:hypothetical protein